MNLNLIAIEFRLFSGGTNDKWVLNLQKVTNCFNLQHFLKWMQFQITANLKTMGQIYHVIWYMFTAQARDVLETWKPMDAITLTNALISIHYWDDNWSFESALLRFIVCFIIYRPHKWEKKCLSTCNISKVSIFSWSSAEYFVIIMFKGKWFLKQIILFKTTHFCYRRTDWWWSPLLDQLHILKKTFIDILSWVRSTRNQRTDMIWTFIKLPDMMWTVITLLDMIWTVLQSVAMIGNVPPISGHTILIVHWVWGIQRSDKW